MQVLLGNIVALMASLVMMYSGYVKIKKKILLWQIANIILFIISNAILGGITGVIINVISLVSNILCYKDKLNIQARSILIVLATVLSLTFNNLSFIGLFPLFAMIINIALMNLKDVQKFKLMIITTMILWASYDIVIKSYTSCVFDILTIITNTVAIVQINRKNMEKESTVK